MKDNDTTVDALAEFLELPSWDEVDERNWELVADAGAAAEAEADEDEDADEVREKAEQEAQGELYASWYDAVMAAAEYLFEKHSLELVPHYKETSKKFQGTQGRPYDLLVVPATTWSAAASALRQTVNGVGEFHFNTTAEFLASGPYTPRQAVFAHIGYVASYPEVYGDKSAQAVYEGAF